MAIIVPILVSYGATALGVAATTATMMATAASVVFQVSGLNNKINKAASKVFGEDLVMIANVAGAVYGAVNGGFDFGSGATNASSINAINGMDAASDAFSAANAAAGGGLVSDGLSALGGADALTSASSAFSINGMDSASDSFSLANKAAGGGLASDGVGISSTTPGPAQGMNLLDSTKSVGTDTKALAEATKTAENTGAARDITASPAVSQTAAAPAASSVASNATAPAASGAKAAAATATKPGSFFDKLLSNDKAVGELIKGVGGGISSAANAKAEKDKLDWQKKRYTATPTTRIVQ